MPLTIRRPVRWTIATLVAVVALGAIWLLLATGDGGDAAEAPRIVQPGAPGESSRELSEEELADLEPPPHTSADVRFMQDMIVHHRQALAMTALVPDRTDSDDVSLLALRIEESQRAEIEQMEAWLAARDEEALPPDSIHAHHGELMPGMLTDEQFAELSSAAGQTFDRRFLELMIQHHGGALTMVSELRADGGGVEVAADTLANHVTADQEIEIGRMQDMLAALAAST
jgi:uncharacterized protein (DUF305 family)